MARVLVSNTDLNAITVNSLKIKLRDSGYINENSKLFKCGHVSCGEGRVVRCENVWGCPICSKRIMRQKAITVSRAMKKWKSENDHALSMITLTCSHHLGDSLEFLTNRLSLAKKILFRSLYYKDFLRKIGYSGIYLTRLEITYAPKINGWNPHFHILLFHKKFDFTRIEPRLQQLWVRGLQKSGLYGEENIGLKISPADDMKSYMTSLNKEQDSGRYDIKTLMEKVGHGEPWALDAYIELSDTMKGKHRLAWSRGAKTAFELDAPQQDAVAKKPRRRNNERGGERRR
ncbi:MAG: protein rep [Victivallaceae bacterium]